MRETGWSAGDDSNKRTARRSSTLCGSAPPTAKEVGAETTFLEVVSAPIYMDAFVLVDKEPKKEAPGEGRPVNAAEEKRSRNFLDFKRRR